MERNPFPEIKILPSIKDVAHFVGRLLTPYPTEAPLYMSNHYRGASEMLDAHLSEPTDGEAIEAQLPIDGGWDDMGCYIDRSKV